MKGFGSFSKFKFYGLFKILTTIDS